VRFRQRLTLFSAGKKADKPANELSTEKDDTAGKR